MKNTYTFIAACVFALLLHYSAFTQEINFSKKILTLGVFEPGTCGIVDGGDKRSMSEPEDSETEEIVASLGAHQIGTGFIYGYNGQKYVITCEHVVFKAGKIIAYDASYNPYDLELVGGDTFYDVAVLKFKNPKEEKLFESIKFDTKLPFLKNDVWAVGYWRKNAMLSSTSGEVLANDEIINHRALPVTKIGFIKSTARLPLGYSGGILHNSQGTVWGMNTMRHKTNKHYYALQSKITKRVIEDIVDFGMVQRCYTGIQFAQGTSDSSVVSVNKILKNSPAAKHKNALIGKTVKSINGMAVKDIYRVLLIMESIRPTTPITLELNSNIPSEEYTFTSGLQDSVQLTNIANHAIEAHKDECLELLIDNNGEIAILNDDNELEKVSTVGIIKDNSINDDLVYCLNSVKQLGILVRIFGLRRELKIGTGNTHDHKAGKWIRFSEEVNTRILYY